MKYVGQLTQSAVLFILLAAGAMVSQAQSNTIYGHVYDAQNRLPVPDLYVELQNQLGLTLGRSKTDSAGRFFFGRLSSSKLNRSSSTSGPSTTSKPMPVNTFRS